jgi:hypothetical protein
VTSPSVSSLRGGDLSRRALEALALEEYKLGKHELRRLLGFGTRDALDGFFEDARRIRALQPR